MHIQYTLARQAKGIDAIDEDFNHRGGMIPYWANPINNFHCTSGGRTGEENRQLSNTVPLKVKTNIKTDTQERDNHNST